jgi:hypothetical protein
MPNSDPVTAWKALKEGNERFVAGKPQHPSLAEIGRDMSRFPTPAHLVSCVLPPLFRRLPDQV